ncbi:MAG: sulfatase [Candidatus Bathyarchaeota archaeon]|nr:MAG: sulfatase [Candidatus Bathyarchaeota archaeon]
MDCLRADHLGCLGYLGNTTPNLDSLAKKGILFSQAISNGGNTVSAFPAILTSSYSRMHHLRESGDLPHGWLFLSETRKSIAEILKSNGYNTAAFLSNPWVSSFFHYNRGFDDFYDKTSNSLSKAEIFRGFGLAYKILDSFRVGHALYSILKGSKGNADRARIINDKAISWLKEHSGNFFLWLHYMDAHEPYIPLESTISERLKAVRLFRKSKDPQFSKHNLRILVDLYDREIKYVDREIGILLNRISKMGLLENTYIILTSDHGQQFMEHGIIGHGYLYDEVVRVPLMISGPGIPPNTLIQKQVCLLDLSPTILDLLNIPKAASFQGETFLPKIFSEKKQEEGVIIEGIPFKHQGKTLSRFCLRTEKWKYILLLNENYEQVDAELYDIISDPAEQKNIARREEKIVYKMKLKLLDHIDMEKREQKPQNMREMSKLEFNKENRREIERRLEGLGYI